MIRAVWEATNPALLVARLHGRQPRNVEPQELKSSPRQPLDRLSLCVATHRQCPALRSSVTADPHWNGHTMLIRRRTTLTVASVFAAFVIAATLMNARPAQAVNDNNGAQD